MPNELVVIAGVIAGILCNVPATMGNVSLHGAKRRSNPPLNLRLLYAGTRPPCSL